MNDEFRPKDFFFFRKLPRTYTGNYAKKRVLFDLKKSLHQEPFWCPQNSKSLNLFTRLIEEFLGRIGSQHSRAGKLSSRLGRNSLAESYPRAIGDMEFKQNKFLPAEKQIITSNPDINTVELCDDDDFLVLACDGIWDCMSSQQLVDFVREQLNSENKLSAVCERVLDRCLAPSTAGGEGCDNMTMIIVQFKKPIVSMPTVSTSERAENRSKQAEPESK